MINIEHVWFSYTGLQPYILNDINISIEDGEYISIVGDNGCGKTTLMRILLGFLKPTKGTVSLQTKQIGYVPQKNDYTNSNFPITVYELLNSYRKLLKIKDKTIINRALQLVGMEPYMHSLMGKISGGQTQKILLARAMLGNPKLLILDEPSTGVDADSKKEIYSILKRMSIEENITIIAVEHNLEAVIANSTKIYHIKNGYGHLCNPDKYAKEYLYPRERKEDYATI